MPQNQEMNDMADDAFDAADLGECQYGGGNWTKDQFHEKVGNDNNRFGQTVERAQDRYDECVDKDKGDNDWNKIEHYSSKVVLDHKQGWKSK